VIARKKAVELHKRYGSFEYPIDIEDVAKKEGLKVIDWPLLSPVNEVKRGNWIGIREGLSSEWRRWDIAHALGHHLMHHGNQLSLSPCSQTETGA
jgi:Zn-dependent peptidase ImmA (M78 family)